MMRGGHREGEPTADAYRRWREHLHAAAEGHEPDETAMWERIEASTNASTNAPAGRASRRRTGVWMVAAAVGTAAATVAGSLAAVSFSSEDKTPVVPLAERSGGGTPATRQPGAGHPSSAGAATGSSGPTPSSRPSSGTPKTSPGTTTGRPPASENEVVTVSPALDPHSSDYWAQNNIVLRAPRPLSRLTVTIRVARTARVTPTGSWLSLPQNDFEVSTRTVGDQVVYQWSLREGRTVPAGTHTLAAQYNRGKGHDARKDSFTVTAAVPDGTGSTLRGHF
jgi:hypothetical protein